MVSSESNLSPAVTDRAQEAPASQLQLLAVMEAHTVTGAAKSMLDFCRAARELQTLSGLPSIKTSIVTFARRRSDGNLHRQGSTQSFADKPERLIESPNEFVTAARELGVEVDQIEERFRFDLRVIPGLRKVIERRRPDIILTHHVKSHFLMKCSRLWRQYTWVAFHHGYTTTDLKMRAYNRLDRWSLPTARHVITVCQAFAQELADVGVPREKISVQHNSIRLEQRGGASAEEALALREKLLPGENERLVLAIGRLSHEKAHIDLINAFAHLKRTRPEINARLVIVGDGPERERLEAAATALGINERMLFTGQLSDVRPYYELADLLVLPSHSEGSPYVLLEAMAAGVPVVATAVGGVPEIVENEKSALLIPARDPQAMAAAMARVLSDEQLAHTLATNSSNLVAKIYSPESHLRSLVKLYQRILSDKGA
jgi:glycosyltransferase involved in cell wall biosynthesis